MNSAVVTANDIEWGAAQDQHQFERVAEGHYRLHVPECATSFDVDRLVRDRHELVAEVTVACQLKGAKTFNGNLFSGNVNLSVAWRRRDLVQHLQQRSNAKDVDWASLLDELAARVVTAERDGQPPKLLSAVPRPAPDDSFDLEGLVLPRRHPSMLFGDGGTFKSFLALYVAGYLAQLGVNVLFADWELDEGAHRDRLELLFGPNLPSVYYQRYQKPLVYEIDGIERFIHANHITYVVCDSVGFAVSGAPESSEAATTYAGAVRRFGPGVGSLHLAHVVKPKEDAPDPAKPFGSVFWHNFGRSNWFIKRTLDVDQGSRFSLGLFHKKSNFSKYCPPVGLEIEFTDQRTMLRRVDVADVEEFAKNLPVKSRVYQALKSGLRTIAELEDATGANTDSIKKALNRDRGRLFQCITSTPDRVHRWGLLENRHA